MARVTDRVRSLAERVRHHSAVCRTCVAATLGILVVGALVAASLVVGLGAYNVSARMGHLPGVSWVLHTTYKSSVRFWSPGPGVVPKLTDDMAAIGARHYDHACRMCHSAPGEPQTATVESMEPQPPPIEEAVKRWQANELHWIVKQGVKMTGMPAWPAEKREDDVWAVVAFLERVRGMSPAEYRDLVRWPRADDGDIAYCAGCHGLDGAGRDNGFMPRIDILDAPYIAASLRAYRARLRESGIMEHAASQLGDEQIAKLADYFGGKEPPSPPAASSPAELVARGREIAFGGRDGADTPACRACHGPWPRPRDPLFPTLVGQRADYIEAQLRLWKDRVRGGTSRANLMHVVVHALEEDEMKAVAAYYAAGAPPE